MLSFETLSVVIFMAFHGKTIEPIIKKHFELSETFKFSMNA